VNLSSDFVQKLKEVNDEFDMIALCFDELVSNMPEPHKRFVSSYIDYMENNRIYCPFQGSFADLRRAINEAAMRIGSDVAGKTGITVFKDAFVQLYQNFTNCPKETPQITWAIYMFYTICAIDGYLGKLNCELSFCGIYPANSPCNHLYSEKYLVYPKESLFLQNAYGGASGYRKPLGSISCGDYFPAVRIVERSRLPNSQTVPKICRLRLPQRYQETCWKHKHLRIASIPFAGFPTFHFCSKGSETPVKDLRKLQGEFYIRYAPDMEQQNMDRAAALLDAAIQDGANIVVFPEFIMSQKMLKAIAEHLRLRTKKGGGCSQLIFVIAGTTYLHNDEQYANVMHFIKPNGVILPQTYYKFSPFYTENPPPAHGQDGKEPARHFENIEVLTSPGKECTLLSIEGLALVLPSICRDAIDGDYSQRLAEIFHPEICMVSAWSRSESAFHVRLEHLANSIHTTSILCNCCDAIEKSEEAEVGLLVIPRKKGAAMCAESLPLLRKADCRAHCGDGKGCIYRIDIDFSSTIQSISPPSCIYVPDGLSPG